MYKTYLRQFIVDWYWVNIMVHYNALTISDITLFADKHHSNLQLLHTRSACHTLSSDRCTQGTDMLYHNHNDLYMEFMSTGKC